MKQMEHGSAGNEQAEVSPGRAEEAEKSLLLIGGEESDLGRLLLLAFPRADILPAAKANEGNYAAYSAVVFLGGAEDEGITLLPPSRRALALARKRGTRVLAEYSRVTDEVSFAKPVLTRHERPVCVSPFFEGLREGAILDDEWNERLPVQHVRPGARPILQYTDKPDGFDSVDALPEDEPNRFALWQEEAGLMICTFRLQNFAAARFSPRHSWAALIAGLIGDLGGSCTPAQVLAAQEAYCRFAGPQPLRQAIGRATEWFLHSGVMIEHDGAPYTLLEGVSSRIEPQGEIRFNRQLRTDCTGETAWFFLLRYLWTGKAEDLRISEGLYRMVRDMLVDTGRHKGFVRGSLGWWGSSSYQDDTARGFLLPLLFRRLVTGDERDDALVRLAADYLLSTTGTNGLRPNRVEYCDPEDERILFSQSVFMGGKWRYTPLAPTTISALRASEVNSPSAHYNAYYLGALALAGLLLKEKGYVDAAEKGMESLMSVYPDTAREHSQTQEVCRLVLPLSLLFLSTRKGEHRAWLHRVTDDLKVWEHPSGGFLEWDEGYTGTCSRKLTGESSVYAHNGDPVADLLYSVNWLPQGLMMAYFATGERRYLDLWDSVARFLASVQLLSPCPALSGGWARAVDVKSMEIHGVNNDVDWSCWTIESGWSVAEIASGLLLGLKADDLKGLFCQS